MKIVVLAGNISARQTMGRVLNEAGICPERDGQCQLEFVESITAACESGHHYDGKTVALVWSSAVSGVDLARVEFPGQLVVVLDQNCSDRILVDKLVAKVITEQELNANKLREMLTQVAV